jgi:trehalose 6-phosphate synthase
MAAVGLVTPLRDGMNLVAKEYVAAQDPESPGVLVLSQFAGAAEELDGAVLINPHEPEAMAAAIDSALTMPLPERQARHRRMFRHLAANDINRWAENFLAALAESRQPAKLFDNIRQLFAARRKMTEGGQPVEAHSGPGEEVGFLGGGLPARP